jgi:hypothetical protein
VDLEAGRRYDLDLPTIGLPATPQPPRAIVGIDGGCMMAGYNFDADFDQVGFVFIPRDRDRDEGD